MPTNVKLPTVYEVIGVPPSLKGVDTETSREPEPMASKVAYAGGSGTVTKACDPTE